MAHCKKQRLGKKGKGKAKGGNAGDRYGKKPKKGLSKQKSWEQQDRFEAQMAKGPYLCTACVEIVGVSRVGSFYTEVAFTDHRDRNHGRTKPPFITKEDAYIGVRFGELKP